MSQRIISAVDDSERSYEAVAVAADLGERLQLPLMLAHVVDEPVGFPFGDPNVMERERREREGRGADLLRDIAMTFDLPPETELRTESGDPATMLRTLASEEDAAMVVVASRGRGRVRAALFGSMTADLVHGLGCPLLVVAPGAGTRYRRAAETHEATVVCGIDGSTRIDDLVPQCDRLAKALRARLLILHAELPPMASSRGIPTTAGVSIAGAPMVMHDRLEDHHDAVRERLERARDLATQTTEVEIRAELGDLAATMNDIAEQPSAQVLAIAQDSAWQRLASHAGCPVLVVPSSGGGG